MSALQSQVIQSLNGLSDDNLQFILDMIQKFMKPVNTENTVDSKTNIRKIGIFEHHSQFCYIQSRECQTICCCY